jgi:hypothetical protein
MSDAGGFASRRNSYHSNANAYDNRQATGSGYYGSRQAAAARGSWGDSNAGHNNGNASYYGAGYGPHRNSRHGGAPPNPNPTRSQYDNIGNNGYGSRQNNNGHGVYPTPGAPYQQSRDTVNTHGSNGSHSEHYSAEQSSESSSLERGGPVRQPDSRDLGEQYGFSGFGGNTQPILEEFGGGDQDVHPGYFNHGHHQQQAYGNVGPQVPAKMGNGQRLQKGSVIQLSGGGQGQGQGGGAPAVGGGMGTGTGKGVENADKRKSWFKRRFSKDK